MKSRTTAAKEHYRHHGVIDIYSEGGITVLAGGTGKGRSWLMLQLAGEIAAGLPRLGVFSSFPHRVLFLNSNNPISNYRNRFRRGDWRARYGSRAQNWLYHEPERLELDTATGADGMECLIRKSQAEVVVVDCLWSMTGGVGSASVRSALGYCQRLCHSLGISFIFSWFLDDKGRYHDQGEPRVLQSKAVERHADTIIALTATACRKRRLTFLKNSTGLHQLDFQFHPGTAIPYELLSHSGGS